MIILQAQRGLSIATAVKVLQTLHKATTALKTNLKQTESVWQHIHVEFENANLVISKSHLMYPSRLQQARKIFALVK